MRASQEQGSLPPHCPLIHLQGGAASKPLLAVLLREQAREPSWLLLSVITALEFIGSFRDEAFISKSEDVGTSGGIGDRGLASLVSGY